jgi:hypothetical protein
MKDATGELSMTAVAVVAIAAIGVVFTTLIWPRIKTQILRSTYCSQAFSCTECDNGTCSCLYCEGDDDQVQANSCANPTTINCPDNNNNR